MKKVVALILAVIVFVLCYFMFPSYDMLKEVYTSLAKKTDSKGEGVRIAIIDSGVNSPLLSTDSSINFSKDSTSADVIDHGTPVFNIIKCQETGLASAAEVFSLKVFNKSGISSMSALVHALEWCMENNIDIINISLSFSIYDENVENLCYALLDSGVIIVSSISNEMKNIDYPSMYKGVIAVGYTKNYSQYDADSSVIFCSPCTVKTVGQDGSLKNYDGNSVVAPIITGIIANILSDNDKYRKGESNGELLLEVKALLEQSDFQIVK